MCIRQHYSTLGTTTGLFDRQFVRLFVASFKLFLTVGSKATGTLFSLSYPSHSGLASVERYPQPRCSSSGIFSARQPQFGGRRAWTRKKSGSPKFACQTHFCFKLKCCTECFWRPRNRSKVFHHFRRKYL